MIRNYLSIAKRLLISNLLYFIVNLIGLALGIACCVIAYFNWEFHEDFDSGHIREEQIFKVNTTRNFENQVNTYGISPVPLAEFAKLESSGIESAVNIYTSSDIIKLDQKVFTQHIHYVGDDFLEIFSFEIISGDKSNLKSPDQVFITEKTAIQYYGDIDCLGNPLTLVAGDGKEMELSIAGIIQDHPLNSSFKFDALLNKDVYEDINQIDEEDWSEFAHVTFLLLSENEDSKEVSKQIQEFINPLNESREDWIAEEYQLVSLNDMANNSRYIRGNYLGQNNPAGAIMIPNIMAVIILLVACFNFMNTSISLSGKRLKEIGVRKAIGARRGQLIAQLLSENVLVIVLSLVLGIFLAEFLIPFYSQLGPWIDLSIDYSGNISFFLFLAGLLLLTAILSGAYPAFYVSKFNTANIFSGNFRLKGSGVLAKGLMVLQLGFSLIALIQGIVYVENTSLQKNYDLGYRKSGVITIPIQEGMDFELFRDKSSSYTFLNEIAGSRHHIGYNNSSAFAEIGQDKKEIRTFGVGEKYLKTMGIEIIDGRGFLDDSESDKNEAIIVTQKFLEEFKLESALDQRVLLDEKPYRIVGVAKNFYPYGLWRDETKYPIAVRLTDKNEFRFVTASVNGNVDEADEQLKKTWNQLFPDVPYESDKYNIHVYRSELLSNNMANLNIFLALTALFLSATGLFTLISINIQKRTKEIGLRRILGASVFNVVGLINRGYIWLIGTALIVGTILGAYLTEIFMDLMFSVHAHVGPFAIGLTTGMVVFIVIITSGYKVIKAASSPPVESLRYE